MRCGLALAFMLGLSGCTPAAATYPAFVVDRAPPTASVTVAIAPRRALATVARSWRVSDIFAYEITLRRFDTETSTFMDLPTPRRVMVTPKPGIPPQAVIPNLEAGSRYEVTVAALGNVGGTAGDVVLNAILPARVGFEVVAGLPVPPLILAVPLDPTPFDLTVHWPSNAVTPGSIPSWCTGLDAVVAEAATPATRLVTKTYTPAQHVAIDHLRGDVTYALSVVVRSATGSTTSTIPDFRVDRVDGAEQDVTPTFPPLVPPTGTLLAVYPLTSASGVVVDLQDRIWVTNQNHNTVTVLNSAGQPAAFSPIAVGNKPRGIGLDRNSGVVWVGNSTGFSVTRIDATGTKLGTTALGFFVVPGGIDVDASGRGWIAGNFTDTAIALNSAGTAIAGSPFAIGGGPAGVAVDQVSGDIWITNSTGNTVSRLTSAGVVAGTFATGAKPTGVAIDANHVAWVVATDANKVRRFNPDGSSAGADINVAAGGPQAICIDPTSQVAWVATVGSGNAVTRITAAGVSSGPYGVGGFPAALAVDSRQHVWVAGSTALSEVAP